MGCELCWALSLMREAARSTPLPAQLPGQAVQPTTKQGGCPLTALSSQPGGRGN